MVDGSVWAGSALVKKAEITGRLFFLLFYSLGDGVIIFRVEFHGAFRAYAVGGFQASYAVNVLFNENPLLGRVTDFFACRTNWH